MAPAQFSALQVEEDPLEMYLENLSMLHTETDEEVVGVERKHPRTPPWHALPAIAGLILGITCLAYSMLLASSSETQKLSSDVIGEVEDKYVETDLSWKGPQEGILGSELWGSCGLHMYKCGGLCCCEQGYSWRTEFKVRESRTKKQLAQQPAPDKCVPEVEAPTRVTQTLAAASRIEDSHKWIAAGASCSKHARHSHVCGASCCCDAGFQWSRYRGACAKK